MRRIRSPLSALLAGALALASPTARGQIVNVQPLVSQNDKSGFSGNIDGSADWRGGNTRLLVLSTNTLVQYRGGRNLVFLIVRGEFGRRAGQEFARRHFEHLRYRVDIAGPLQAEAFVQYEEDPFRRLAVRAVTGAGPRLVAVDWPWFQVAFATIPMVAYEQLASGNQPDAGEQRVNFRLSCYSLIAVRPSERIKIAQTIYVQPRVADVHDVRVLHELEALVLVTKHLAFKSSITSAYDSEPPTAVAPLDTTLKSSVQITF